MNETRRRWQLMRTYTTNDNNRNESFMNSNYGVKGQWNNVKPNENPQFLVFLMESTWPDPWIDEHT